MYKIKTSDDKQHGPFMANVVRQWVNAGKTDGQTMLQKVGEAEWKPLEAFPEFGGPVPPTADVAEPGGRSGSRSHSRSRSRSSSQMGRSQPRTSPLAVASLILGLLGVTAFLGLVLGIVAQIKISRSHDTVRGAGYAISGMVVSGIMLLFGVPIAIGLLVPPWVREQERGHETLCLERAHLVASALQQFAREHAGAFPDPHNWCDELVSAPWFQHSRVAFVCPSEPHVRSGYALNSNLVAQVVSNTHPRTVLFFESAAGWNGQGGFAQLANYRHRGRVTIGFADGSVQGIEVWQLSQLRWLP